ncbi:hypothetical protein [Aquabacter cavernae]|uniref:hypothetical protein n=1 Tax=Aquabacter cavernae TaxID=2496029 RepID=UPI000F8CB835|nr:hypothetical protein [Aquabacter cavernae]
MSNFDLVARVFGIVLALAVSELLKGFARLWRIRHGVEEVAGPPIHVGWLIPILGAFMLLDQVTFWFNFGVIGPHVPSNLFALAGFMAVIGVYFGLSTFVFPVDVKLWSDFDAYYFKVRTIVIGGLLAVNFVVLAYQGALALSGIDMGEEEGGLVSFAATIVTVGVLVALLFVSGRRTSLILLITAFIATLVADLPF